MDGFGERRGGFRRRSGGDRENSRYGGGSNNYGNTPKPVSVGAVVDLTIEATGAKGDGIAKKDGFVIFVKGASQGQTVKVKITGVGRSSGTGEVVDGAASAPAAPATEEPAATESASAGEAPADESPAEEEK